MSDWKKKKPTTWSADTSVPTNVPTDTPTDDVVDENERMFVVQVSPGSLQDRLDRVIREAENTARQRNALWLAAPREAALTIAAEDTIRRSCEALGMHFAAPVVAPVEAANDPWPLPEGWAWSYTDTDGTSNAAWSAVDGSGNRVWYAMHTAISWRPAPDEVRASVRRRNEGADATGPWDRLICALDDTAEHFGGPVKAALQDLADRLRGVE